MLKTISKLLTALVLSLTSFSHIEAQKIFMTGDSHVFSKIYPNTVESKLRGPNPDIEFSWWAKNGICFYSFNHNPEYFDSIFSFNPDILIVHLGTNGAFADNFTKQAFGHEMEAFYETLMDHLPQLKVVFVTPFTNKKRRYRKRGKWRINYQNREAADVIKEFADAHENTFVVDNNASTGMKYIKSLNLIRRDNVHLTEAGYIDLGEEVGNEILNIGELWSSLDPGL